MSTRFQVVALDADDTLWHNEPLFSAAQARFQALLGHYHDAEWIDARLYETEKRSLRLFGYGVKGFTLSMIEAAIELTEGRITGAEVQEIMGLGLEMLRAPVELLEGVQETVAESANEYPLMLLTKGDLFDQESKLARPGAGFIAARIGARNEGSARVSHTEGALANSRQSRPGASPRLKRRMAMFRPESIVAAALLLGTPAYAQDRTAEIDRIFSSATPEAPGCAVGVSHHGKVVVNRAYGLADLERRVPLTPSSVFDIGSTQKQFVAAAVLLLAEEDRLSLSDDIRKYVPELPDVGHKVTLDHLLTHTSGVRDWTGLSNFSSAEEEALTMILRQRGLNFAPGEEWSYSNSGYVLLKEIVARVSGMPFSEFTRRRLFEPLGMNSTMYAADIRAAGEHGAVAYEKEGDGWKPDMMLGDERGGGAVLTTAGDLLIWNDALANGRLGAFVSEKIQEPARLRNGRELGYARGLFVDEYEGLKRVWHTGSARAFKSVLARFPERGLSIAILCNSGDTDDRPRVMRRLVDMFAPAPDAPDTAAKAPAEAAGAQGPDLSGKAGLFFGETTGEPLRLLVNNGRLRIAGGPPLVAVARDRFRNPEGRLSFMSQDEFELRFLSPDEIELRSMEGETTRYRRARPYAPTPAELQAFAGRYESDELGAVFEVAPGSEGLTIRLNGGQILEFAPVERDAFQRGMMTVRFRRDGDGKVVALDYSNPMLRNLKFTRLGDRTVGAAASAQPSAPPTAAPAVSTSTAPGGTHGRVRAPQRAYPRDHARGRPAPWMAGGRRKARPLALVSGMTFSAADSPTSLTFTLGADGRATAVVMRQNGRERTLPKVR